jgi:hypothetical protein
LNQTKEVHGAHCAWRKQDVYTEIQVENFRERDNLGDIEIYMTAYIKINPAHRGRGKNIPGSK